MIRHSSSTDNTDTGLTSTDTSCQRNSCCTDQINNNDINNESSLELGSSSIEISDSDSDLSYSDNSQLNDNINMETNYKVKQHNPNYINNPINIPQALKQSGIINVHKYLLFSVSIIGSYIKRIENKMINKSNDSNDSERNNQSVKSHLKKIHENKNDKKVLNIVNANNADENNKSNSTTHYCITDTPKETEMKCNLLITKLLENFKKPVENSSIKNDACNIKNKVINIKTTSSEIITQKTSTATNVKEITPAINHKQTKATINIKKAPDEIAIKKAPVESCIKRDLVKISIEAVQDENRIKNIPVDKGKPKPLLSENGKNIQSLFSPNNNLYTSSENQPYENQYTRRIPSSDININGYSANRFSIPGYNINGSEYNANSDHKYVIDYRKYPLLGFSKPPVNNQTQCNRNYIPSQQHNMYGQSVPDQYDSQFMNGFYGNQETYNNSQPRSFIQQQYRRKIVHDRHMHQHSQPHYTYWKNLQIMTNTANDGTNGAFPNFGQVPVVNQTPSLGNQGIRFTNPNNIINNGCYSNTAPHLLINHHKSYQYNQTLYKTHNKCNRPVETLMKSVNETATLSHPINSKVNMQPLLQSGTNINPIPINSEIKRCEPNNPITGASNEHLRHEFGVPTSTNLEVNRIKCSKYSYMRGPKSSTSGCNDGVSALQTSGTVVNSSSVTEDNLQLHNK